MTAAARRLVLLVAAVYMALFWLWAGLAKAFLPDAAYSFAARVVGGGTPAHVVVVLSVVLETFLGTALITGALRRTRLLWASVALLLAFTVLLGIAKSTGGGALECGCYAFFATSAASVDRELWINVGHAALLGAVLSVVTLAAPDATAPAETADGPGRQAQTPDVTDG